MIRTMRKNVIYLLLLSVMTAACGKEKGVEPEEHLPNQQNNTVKVRMDAKNREAKGERVNAVLSKVENGTFIAVGVDFGEEGGNLAFSLRNPEKSKTYQFDTDYSDDHSTIGYSVIVGTSNQVWLAPAFDLKNHGKTVGKLTVEEFDTVKNRFRATFSVQAYNLIQDTQKTFTNGEIDVVFLNNAK